MVLRYANSAAGICLFPDCWTEATKWHQHPAVIDALLGDGHVVLFSTNPFWRGQTKGSYFLVFNAILNFDNLNAGRKAG